MFTETVAVPPKESVVVIVPFVIWLFGVTVHVTAVEDNAVPFGHPVIVIAELLNVIDAIVPPQGFVTVKDCAGCVFPLNERLAGEATSLSATVMLAEPLWPVESVHVSVVVPILVPVAVAVVVSVAVPFPFTVPIVRSAASKPDGLLVLFGNTALLNVVVAVMFETLPAPQRLIVEGLGVTVTAAANAVFPAATICSTTSASASAITRNCRT
jgi:hypothetical protein